MNVFYFLTRYFSPEELYAMAIFVNGISLMLAFYAYDETRREREEFQRFERLARRAIRRAYR